MQIRVLGPFTVAHGDGVAALGGPRQRSVLAMLVLAAPAVVSTDRLVDGIWGEEPPARPLPTLQVFVHKLRRALADLEGDDAPARLVSKAPGYALAVDPGEVDVNLFIRWRDEARAAAPNTPAVAADLYAKALGLWRGPALADLRDLPFAEGEVVRLEEERLSVEEDAFDTEIALGRHDQLVAQLEQRVVAHPMRERFWGQLMVALYRAGRQADALAAYGRARDRLADELGIDPSEALRQLELGILRQDPSLAAPAAPAAGPALSDDSAASRVRPREPARVPTPVNTTVGRDDATTDLCGVLASGVARLVTLTGTGGVGKTRLASVVAHASREEFPDGTWFLALPDDVPAGRLLADLLRAVTGRADQDDGLAALAEALSDRRVLLVLDNLEGVADAAEVVGGLLTACPQTQVLATSRIPLGLSMEQQYDVAPLPVPERGDELDDLRASPAVELFLSRARATSPRFDLTVDNADGVRDLCRMLDGVPLAIELAAARVRVLSPAAIAANLRTGLELLTSTAPDLPGRQRALATTVAWSYSRLDESAQRLCRRLSLFEAGFTLAAAEQVCGGDPGASDLMDSLTALVDAGLVRVQDTRVEVRFALLGTVRAFVRPLMESQPDADERRGRLTALLLEQARAWADEVDGPAGDLALGRFDDASPDLVAAVERERSAGRISAAVEIAMAMSGYWVAAGHLTDGLALAESLVPVAADDRPVTARARTVCGKLAYHLTDWDRARSECEEALRLLDGPSVSTAAGADLTAATARCYLAGALAVTEPTRAAALADQALSEAEQTGAYAVEVVSLSILAIASAVRGDLDGERRYYERRLSVVRSRGDRARIADTLNTLAEIALDEADVSAALSFAQESLALAGDRLPGEARDARISLARAYLGLDAVDEALEHLAHAVRLTERTGQALAYAQSLRTAACLAAVRGDPVTCVRLFAAAQEVQPSPSGTDEPVERDFADRLASARAALGDAASRREWVLGGTVPPAQVRSQLDRLLAPPLLPAGHIGDRR